MPMLEVRDREWIGTYFDYSNFTFPDGSEWAVFRKISEKALLFPSRSVTEESASQTDGSCGGDTEVISDDGIDDSYSDAGDLREDLNNTASESSLTRENLDKANASNDSFQHVTIEDTTNYFPGFGVSKFVHMHDEGQPAEAQAVYECYQVRGNDVGKWAIMKIRVQ